MNKKFVCVCVRERECVCVSSNERERKRKITDYDQPQSLLTILKKGKWSEDPGKVQTDERDKPAKCIEGK